jgi:hypothetical protein
MPRAGSLKLTGGVSERKLSMSCSEQQVSGSKFGDSVRLGG